MAVFSSDSEEEDPRLVKQGSIDTLDEPSLLSSTVKIVNHGYRQLKQQIKRIHDNDPEEVEDVCKTVKHYLSSAKYVLDDKIMADLIDAIASVSEIHAKQSGDLNNATLQRLNELFPDVVSRLHSMQSHLTSESAARLFHSLRKLQPVANPSHNSVLSGLQSRLEMSVGKEVFTNQAITDCYCNLKAFPNSDLLKETLVLLGCKIHDSLQDQTARTNLTCAQYSKVGASVCSVAVCALMTFCRSFAVSRMWTSLMPVCHAL